MNVTDKKLNKVLYAFCGVAFAFPTLFFAYYTARLIYINLTMSADDAAAHRTGGMLMGAIAFPLAAIVCGIISWFFCKRAFKKAPHLMK